MSAIEEVIAGVQAAQQQLDAAIAQCGQAMAAADNGYQLAMQVGSQSSAAGLQQVRQQIEAMQQQIAAAKTGGDAAIRTAQQVAAGT
ncbi:MAG: hypothetical protein ACRDTM_05355 [Micromonosporaceae bacterium]